MKIFTAEFKGNGKMRKLTKEECDQKVIEILKEINSLISGNKHKELINQLLQDLVLCAEGKFAVFENNK